MLANVHFVMQLKSNRVRMLVAKGISEIDGPRIVPEGNMWTADNSVMVANTRLASGIGQLLPIIRAMLPKLDLYYWVCTQGYLVNWNTSHNWNCEARPTVKQHLGSTRLSKNSWIGVTGVHQNYGNTVTLLERLNMKGFGSKPEGCQFKPTRWDGCFGT